MKRHILFIGIVGHAMRGLALATRNLGDTVTGLDEVAETGLGTDWLDEQHIQWTREPKPALLDGVDLVIISGGTAANHPLLLEAQTRKIKIQSFAEFLGELTAAERSLVVAGTHGKTTTTSFLTWLLESAGREPDFLVGIRPFNFESSARLGGGKVFVAEGDEYKASNLDLKSKLQYYHPDVLILTSAEHDHPDMFTDEAAVVARFVEVVARLPKSGRLVAWAGSPAVRGIAAKAPCEVVTYGIEAADYVASESTYGPEGVSFDANHLGHNLGRLRVPLYGRHNVLNALAATIVAVGEGLSLAQIQAGADGFKGAYRRFNFLTPPTAPITVIDDYAHHPSEAAAMLEAAKLHFPGRRIVAVYRPHTYSRTAALLSEYHAAFGDADEVWMSDIEGAREADAATAVSGADVISGLNVPAHFEPDRAKLADKIIASTTPGDVIICMTVSGYQDLAGELAMRLTEGQ